MERFSKLQLHQLKASNNQMEALLTRTKSVALVNKWRQNQHMRTYQSEYDILRNGLSKSALPCQIQEGLSKEKEHLISTNGG